MDEREWTALDEIIDVNAGADLGWGPCRAGPPSSP